MPTRVIHDIYLPFTEAQLLGHFASPIKENQDVERHLAYYRESVKRLAEFNAGPPPTGRNARSAIRRARQIEKDERFWVASALMGIFHSVDAPARWEDLMTTTFGEEPPLPGFMAWGEALRAPLRLYFETSLPSPPSYRSWLRNHIDQRALVPYIREAAATAGDRLEGPTHVDALLLSEETGFAVLFEAKALSDVDSKISFDVMRNQIARNVDVMLESNPGLAEPLCRRDPDRTCFALLTPQVFKDNPHSRLYGWLLHRYWQDPDALALDLRHRGDVDWHSVSRRLGWVTFEDCDRISPGACRWFVR